MSAESKTRKSIIQKLANLEGEQMPVIHNEY